MNNNINIPAAEFDKFEEAFSELKNMFGIENFYPDQKDLIRSFCCGNNIYFSAGTGYGKSLVFQSMPLVYDFINEKAFGTSTLLVVCPLISLMDDQIKSVTNMGLNAVAIHQNTVDIKKKT